MLAIIIFLLCLHTVVTAENYGADFNTTSDSNSSTRPRIVRSIFGRSRFVRSSDSEAEAPTETETPILPGAGITLTNDVHPIATRSLYAPTPPEVMRSLRLFLELERQRKLVQNQPSYYYPHDTGLKKRSSRDCSRPSVATRSLIDPHLNRPYFAHSQEEVEEKKKRDEYSQYSESEREKRSVQSHYMLSSLEKRSTASTATVNGTGLPWTCETKFEWMDMGVNNYPRFVRTAECKSRVCFNGFFRCKPRRYKTKVLRRVSGGDDSSSCEEEDVSLPEALRPSWKFQSVTINLCCDCTGRMPGAHEIN